MTTFNHVVCFERHVAMTLAASFVNCRGNPVYLKKLNSLLVMEFYLSLPDYSTHYEQVKLKSYDSEIRKKKPEILTDFLTQV